MYIFMYVSVHAYVYVYVYTFVRIYIYIQENTQYVLVYIYVERNTGFETFVLRTFGAQKRTGGQGLSKTGWDDLKVQILMWRLPFKSCDAWVL